MSTRIKFFRDGNQAIETRQFLSTQGIKSYIRERSSSRVTFGQESFGYDLFALRDEDIREARQLLDYEYGASWGDGQES